MLPATKFNVDDVARRRSFNGVQRDYCPECLFNFAFPACAAFPSNEFSCVSDESRVTVKLVAPFLHTNLTSTIPPTAHFVCEHLTLDPFCRKLFGSL